MKTAICFAGGGSRGAYEFGVWRALRECSLDFDIALGTSIGSVNSALYVQGDFAAAEEFWDGLSMDKVMVSGINIDRSLEKLIDQKNLVRPFFKSYRNHKGADISPFIETLNKFIDEEKFFASEVDFACVTVKLSGLEPLEILKQNIERGSLCSWLQASCACFPIFPMCEIDGHSYIDGGYYDNLPIATAFRMGADRVFAIDLDHEACHPDYQNHPYVAYIKPSCEIGSIMCFDNAEMKRLQTVGYNDAMKAYGRYLGKKFTFDFDFTRPQIIRTAQLFIKSLSLAEAGGDLSYSQQATSVVRSRVLLDAPLTSRLTQLCRDGEINEKTMLAAAFEAAFDCFELELDRVYGFDEACEILHTKLKGLSSELEKAKAHSAWALILSDRIPKLQTLKSNEKLIGELTAAALLDAAERARGA